MQVVTNAFYLGATKIHSNKTGKDYVKIALAIDGGFASFITPKNVGDGILQGCPKVVDNFIKTHAPQGCEVTLNLEFTERGNFTGIDSIKELGK